MQFFDVPYLLAVFFLPGYVLLKRFSGLKELGILSLAPVVSVLVYGLVFYPMHVLFGTGVNPAITGLILAASAVCGVVWRVRPKAERAVRLLLLLFVVSFAAKALLLRFEPEPRVGDVYWHFLLAKSFFGSDWYSMYVVDNFWTNQSFPYHPSYRPPLYNFMLSLAMLADGTYQSAQLVNVLFGSLLVFPAYLVSKNFLREDYAVAAAVLTTFNPWVFDRSLFAMPHVLVIYFILLFLQFYLSRDVWGSWFYLGAVAGAGYLTHPTFQIFLVAAALLFLVEHRRRVLDRRLVLIAAVFLAITLPWFVRNIVLFGNPVDTPSRYMLFAGEWGDYSRLSPPAKSEFLARGLPAFALDKAGEMLNTFVLIAGPVRELLFDGKLDLAGIYGRLFVHGGCYNNALFCVLTPPMFVAMLLGFGIAGRLRRLTGVYLASGLAMSMFLFGYNNPGGDLQFIPAIIPLGTMLGLLYLEKKCGTRRKMALAALFLVFAAYSGYTFYENHFGVSWKYSETLKIKDSALMAYLRERTDAHDVIMSDNALPIAYYTGRPTVVLPKGTDADVVRTIRRYNASFLVIREKDAGSIAAAGGYPEVFAVDGWDVLLTKKGEG